MGSPYLNSGETIVLTTSRVSVDAVSYDVMLTSERIFFIDNRKARLEPRIIPLSTILSVQGGKTPAQDPVITLMFRARKEGDTRQPLNLIFSQDPNENRRPERDDWVRGLIQLSINQHEKGAGAEKPAVPEATRESGLRPMARHGVAPEMVRPLSNVIDHNKTPAHVTIIPEDIAGSGEIPVRTAATPPEREERPASDQPDVPVTSFAPVRGSPPPVPHPAARVVIPQIIEELLPLKKLPAQQEEQVPAPVAVYEEALFRTIPAPVRSMTVTEEKTPSPPMTAETVPVPEAGAAEPVFTEPEEVPEIIRALHTGAREPVTTEPAITTVSGTGPEPVQDSPESVYESQEPVPESPESVYESPEPVPESQGSVYESPGPADENREPEIPEISEPQVAPAVPGTGVQEPAVHPAQKEIRHREPEAAEATPVRHPIPPAREIRPFSTTLTYIAVALIIVVLAGAGAVFIVTQGPGPADSPVTPVPTTVQVTTPPVTLPPTVPPATTRAVTPVSTPVPVSVPPTGIWVRLTSTSEYYGSVGNAGTMRQITGTGDNLYQIFWRDRTVQVSVQKNDNSGAMLSASVYRDGTVISSRSVTSPMGAIEILIDPQTARAPGLTEADTNPDRATPQPALEYY